MKSVDYIFKTKTHANFGILFSLMGLFLCLLVLFGDKFNIKLAVSPMIVFGIALFFFILGMYSANFSGKKYFSCPYCDKSILAVYDWTCDHCHNKQGKKRSIGEPCAHCKRHLETYICPFCQEEFKL